MIRGGESGLTRDIHSIGDRWLVDAPVNWTTYNPLRPEPPHRNAAMTIADIARATGHSDAPVVRAVYAKVGIARDDQLRVLICDGPSLLGYVGLFQGKDFEKRQKRLLSRLVPAMQRRLSRERLLSGAASTQLLLAAALEEIPSAAFVLGDRGRVHEANRLGEVWLSAHGLAGRRALRDAVLVRGAARGFRVTRIASAAETPKHLVVEVTTAATWHAAERAGVHWGFTAREREVLRAVTEGLPTRTLAAHLAVSERTVEAHLTRMFAKAQVATRAEMVAKALRGA
jgi:DNA-binding CsgD family transcriptional regulator